MIGAYEAKRENRATIMDRIAKLTGDEPWSGYDEQTVDAITSALAGADADVARKVLAYEREPQGARDGHRHAKRERQLAVAAALAVFRRVSACRREAGGEDGEADQRHRRLQPQQQQRGDRRSRRAPARRSRP